MKKFLIKIFNFLIIFLIIALIIDYFITINLKNSYNLGDGEVSVWNDIYNKNINTDILIYGSSRALVHFNPEIIKDSLNLSAYNMGIDGHNFRIQYLRHLEYLKYNKHKPKFILHSLDCFTFEKRNDLYNLEQFLPFMFFNFNIFSYTYNYIGFNLYDYFIPLVRYSGFKNIFSYIFNNNISKNNIRKNGFKSKNLEWNDDLKNAKAKIGSYNAIIEKSEIELYESFLQECKDNGIEVILIYSPEHIEGQKFVKNRQILFNLINNLSKKFNLHFIDYSNDEICYKYEYFYNSVHLNKKGADIFSSKLSSDLKKIINN